MSTLAAPGAAPASYRPHAWGAASGLKYGHPTTRTVEWLFDSGADVGAVQKRLGDCFDLIATGATASPTTGPNAILMKRGMMVIMTVEDASGATRQVASRLDVGVKPNNAGSNLIGMDQVAEVGAVLEWDPMSRLGRLLA
jgi:hypothetical protein